VLKAEITAIRQDRWLFALVVWLPSVLALFLVLIFSAGQPLNLPIGVVDLDQSSLSRKVARYLDASPTLTITRRYSSIKEGKDDISSARIYALVVIPAGLSHDVMRGEAPAITAFFNAQYLLIAKAIRSALIRVESTLAIELDVGRTLVSTPVIKAALATSLPLRTQMSALYNTNMNYATFLVPPLLMAMFQLIII
jgi:ABC-2 type transport system permease protein